jgi:hypothetical protein
MPELVMANDRRDPKQGTAKDAKSAKNLPDDTFLRITHSAIYNRSKIPDLRVSDPK